MPGIPTVSAAAPGIVIDRDSRKRRPAPPMYPMRQVWRQLARSPLALCWSRLSLGFRVPLVRSLVLAAVLLLARTLTLVRAMDASAAPSRQCLRRPERRPYPREQGPPSSTRQSALHAVLHDPLATSRAAQLTLLHRPEQARSPTHASARWRECRGAHGVRTPFLKPQACGADRTDRYDLSRPLTPVQRLRMQAARTTVQVQRTAARAQEPPVPTAARRQPPASAQTRSAESEFARPPGRPWKSVRTRFAVRRSLQ